MVPAGLQLEGSGAALTFPPLQRIAPPLPAAAPEPGLSTSARRRREAGGEGGGLTVPPGLRECGSAKLAAMLRQVEQLPPQWHHAVEALLQHP